MIVIAHQTIRQDLDPPKNMGLVQHVEESFMIHWSPEGSLASQSAIHHMINHTGIFNAQGPNQPNSLAPSVKTPQSTD